jgi:chromate transporter
LDKRSKPARKSGTLAEIAREFLRLGFVAYGGAAAHVAMMEERFVRRKEWLSRERFLDLFGAASMLPGPSSTELVIYLGEVRGGFAGMLVAGACFILPSAFLVVALAWAYLKYGAVPQVAGLLFGIKPVVVALMAQAIWNLARTALKNLRLVFLAVVIVLLAAFGQPLLVLMLGAGVFWMLLSHGKKLVRREFGIVGIGGFGAAAAPGIVSVVPIFFYFLKIGAVLVGSGYVLLAVLRADLVVRLHWLTDAQLLDAIAVSQATPGPFFTVSTFIGYVLAGWRGACLATIGMFLPAFFFVGITARFLPKLRSSPLSGAFLDGVNAAAVALMGFVGWQFARASLITWSAVVIAGASLFLSARYQVNSAWLVLGGAIAGILLRSFGWA